jgi:hypothetical protein
MRRVSDSGHYVTLLYSRGALAWWPPTLRELPEYQLSTVTDICLAAHAGAGSPVVTSFATTGGKMSTSDSDRAWLPREIRELGLHGIDGRSQHVADAGDLEDFIGKPIDHRHRGRDHLLGDGLALIR